MSFSVGVHLSDKCWQDGVLRACTVCEVESKVVRARLAKVTGPTQDVLLESGAQGSL